MPTIEMFTVKSTNIEAVGYDEGSKTMRVAFKSKTVPTVYDYHEIEKSAFDGIMVAVSPGKYFIDEIRTKKPGFKLVNPKWRYYVEEN